MTTVLEQAKSNVRIPAWVQWMQISAFSILYAIWALPETILIRHICLIVGALCGLYGIYQYQGLLLRKINNVTIPAWLLLGLFSWVTLCLFFLSNNFSLQMEEYSGIWKRTALGAIFALGLGLTLANTNQQKLRAYWPVFYFGLLGPTLIYLIKYCLTHYGQRWGINAPDFLKLHYGSFPFYLPKTAYVCFCLPVLGVALGQLKRNIDNHAWFSRGNAIYGLTIPAVFFVFYGENIKNGVVYGVTLIAVFAIALLLKDLKKHWIQKMLLTGVILIAGAIFLVGHIQKNESWRTLVSDAKVAWDTERLDHWKFNGAKGYPNNGLGRMVSITNYERIAWGKEGVILLVQNPLGYGLIERSFGHLAKRQWPDSTLHQSHSGWLDLALGIGIPGILLVLSSLLLSMRQISLLLEGKSGPKALKTTFSRWLSACWWILLACLVMWCTTEISQKVFFDSLIFWIALASGLVAGAAHPSAPAVVVKFP